MAKIYQFKPKPERYYHIEKHPVNGCWYLLETAGGDILEYWELDLPIANYILGLENDLQCAQEEIDHMESTWKKPEPIDMDVMFDNIRQQFAQMKFDFKDGYNELQV